MCAILLLLLWPATALVSQHPSLYAACQLDSDCRHAYHQFPADPAVFDHIYGLGTAADAPVEALLARLPPRVQARLCAAGEQYVLAPDGGVAACRCPDGRCGGPFANWPIYAACFAGTLAIFFHVGGAVSGNI
jgi:hypothetical protein